MIGYRFRRRSGSRDLPAAGGLDLLHPGGCRVTPFLYSTGDNLQDTQRSEECAEETEKQARHFLGACPGDDEEEGGGGGGRIPETSVPDQSCVVNVTVPTLVSSSAFCCCYLVDLLFLPTK